MNSKQRRRCRRFGKRLQAIGNDEPALRDYLLAHRKELRHVSARFERIVMRVVGEHARVVRSQF